MDREHNRASPSHDFAERNLHLVCRFDKRFFAVLVSSVEEVVLPTEVNIVPGAASFVSGIMNLRGEALPILNSQEIMGVATSQIPSCASRNGLASSHVVILTSKQGKFGLTVDKALRVSNMVSLPLPTVEASASGPHSSIQRYALDGGQTILILDPEALGPRS